MSYTLLIPLPRWLDTEAGIRLCNRNLIILLNVHTHSPELNQPTHSPTRPIIYSNTLQRSILWTAPNTHNAFLWSSYYLILPFVCFVCFPQSNLKLQSLFSHNMSGCLSSVFSGCVRSCAAHCCSQDTAFYSSGMTDGFNHSMWCLLYNKELSFTFSLYSVPVTLLVYPSLAQRKAQMWVNPRRQQ